ncbi:hypothetical protein [Yoonia sp. SS1-5]|uniref:Uncharacterized protein n=1 Tax=Yoonia rhodophyticola TaxID=3137370 RepID=A0AAN0MD22_9RHOB
MFEPDQDGVYARVGASAGRRLIAYALLLSLGALLIYLPLVQPPSVIWAIFMIGFGILVLWVAERMRRATMTEILLTETDIRDSTGLVLATMDEVKGVDRGAFAFKPSNGFTLVLNTKKPRGWAPGLWWRVGRRVGVGGVTSAGQSKFMAEQIALRLTNR